MHSGHHIWGYGFNDLRTYFYMKIQCILTQLKIWLGIQRPPVFSSFRLTFTAHNFRLSASLGKGCTLCSFLHEPLQLYRTVRHNKLNKNNIYTQSLPLPAPISSSAWHNMASTGHLTRFTNQRCGQGCRDSYNSSCRDTSREWEFATYNYFYDS